jgi:hypothetical protein
VSELLPGIADDTHPRDLSEGQRLALALAVVLTARPPLLLLDEPTRGLDYAAKSRLVTVLRGLAAEGHAIVLATHDVELAAELAHRVVILADGEPVADGPTAEVVVASPSFAHRSTKILAPQKWLTVPRYARHSARPKGRRSRAHERDAHPRPEPAAPTAPPAKPAPSPGPPFPRRPPPRQPRRSGRLHLALLQWAHLQVSAPPEGRALAVRGLLPLLVGVVAATISESGLGPKAVAMLGVLAATGAALRPIGAGTAGIEPMFFLMVLSGRVLGPGFGFVLGAVTMFASALLTGGVGPWMPFQMLAMGWFTMGAGLLPGPDRLRGRGEL